MGIIYGRNDDMTSTRDSFLELSDAGLLAECKIDCFRGTGPGGQHRNVTDSAVRLKLLSANIVAASARFRSQRQNKNDALKKIRMQLALELRDPPGAAVSATPVVSVKNREYPGYLAGLLDIIYDSEYKIGDAASRLGASTGKLVRILARDPQAWKWINDKRTIAGMRRLTKS